MNTALETHRTPPTKLETQLDYILLDGSSSMMKLWWDSLDGVQAYVDGVRNENIKSQIIVQVFDSHDLEYIARNVPIEAWKALRDEPIGAHWGSTPLYDAINVMAQRLRVLDPPRASIVIVTDGEECASKFTDLHQAKAFLDWMRAKGWQITFIGAQFDNSEQARALGANEHTAIGVSQKRLVDATAALAKKRARYGLYGESMHYSDEEKQRFGGFLPAPTTGDEP